MLKCNRRVRSFILRMSRKGSFGITGMLVLKIHWDKRLQCNDYSCISCKWFLPWMAWHPPDSSTMITDTSYLALTIKTWCIQSNNKKDTSPSVYWWAILSTCFRQVHSFLECEFYEGYVGQAYCKISFWKWVKLPIQLRKTKGQSG